MLYVRAMAALATPVAVDVVVPAVLVRSADERIEFGADYEDYRRDVGRWLPRRHPMS
jgi:protein-S-isoprenylcysteine O-methyltransferase Ste14